ncbi:MAG: tyrosine-type recombinase/integrase [Cyanobacteria bacterium P01_C01_bin.69]
MRDTTAIIEQWLYGRPKRTQDEYLRDVMQALRFLAVDSLEAITLKGLQDYQASLIEVRHLKPASVRRKVAAMRGLLRFAQEQGHIDRNPAIALRSPKDTSSLHERILSREQVQAIIAAASSGRDHALLRFIYASGARISEACGLLWKDCLPQTDGGAVVRLLGKGSKWRSVAIPTPVWDEVNKLRGTATEDEEVFRLVRRDAHDIFKAAAKAAGCPESSCHWFRHSIASHLVAAGMGIVEVRDFLGHANLATTNDYAHATKGKSAGDYLSL